MARGVASDLLQMDKRVGRSAKPPNTKICPGRKASPWTPSLAMIEGAIKPYGNDTVELSMKAPMAVSKPADLGYGVPNCASKEDGNRRQGTRCFTQVRALLMEVKPYVLLD